jgi:hypothetical protein
MSLGAAFRHDLSSAFGDASIDLRTLMNYRLSMLPTSVCGSDGLLMAGEAVNDAAGQNRSCFRGGTVPKPHEGFGALDEGARRSLPWSLTLG